MERLMDLGNMFGLMVINTREILNYRLNMDWGRNGIPMVIFIKGNLWMERRKDRASIFGKMGHFISVSSKME